VQKCKIKWFLFGADPLFFCQNAQKKALFFCQYVFWRAAAAALGLAGEELTLIFETALFWG
jgi:hypothetical protein